ncbi:hypothetical protein NDU88_004449 [Pleurodeles waltl]|uniref:Uncharacterized protein n=1 Tax=Pleurodeles waltl TaxID=8319 RepID=A0AAV7UFB6_PLEWA|nr:hypothetical protein NDU88_004449 [Pleurodeles waltl]
MPEAPGVLRVPSAPTPKYFSRHRGTPKSQIVSSGSPGGSPHALLPQECPRETWLSLQARGTEDCSDASATADGVQRPRSLERRRTLSPVSVSGTPLGRGRRPARARQTSAIVGCGLRRRRRPMGSGGLLLRERELWGCGEAPRRHLSSRGWGDLCGLHSYCCM